MGEQNDYEEVMMHQKHDSFCINFSNYPIKNILNSVAFGISNPSSQTRKKLRAVQWKGADRCTPVHRLPLVFGEGSPLTIFHLEPGEGFVGQAVVIFRRDAEHPSGPGPILDALLDVVPHRSPLLL